MGFHPKPRQGTSPLHPGIGASPQEVYSFYRHSALALRSHLGLRPKTPREPLGCAQEKDVRQKVGPRRVCAPRPFGLSKNS